jgi:hypothetical protein
VVLSPGAMVNVGVGLQFLTWNGILFSFSLALKNIERPEQCAIPDNQKNVYLFREI